MKLPFEEYKNKLFIWLSGFQKLRFSVLYKKRTNPFRYKLIPQQITLIKLCIRYMEKQLQDL